MKCVELRESRRELSEVELRKLLAVPIDFDLVDAMVTKRNGNQRALTLVFKKFDGTSQVSVDALGGGL